MRPVNDNRPDPIKDIVAAMHMGQKFSASMDSITLRAMREGWTKEQYGQAINQALFGGTHA